MFCSVPLLTDWIVPYELAPKMTMLDNTRAVQWETYPGPDGFALEVNVLTDSKYLYPYNKSHYSIMHQTLQKSVGHRYLVY
jgi:hypothetical protein